MNSCILCDKIIKKNQKTFRIAIEKPVRIDIVVHRACSKKTSEKDIKRAVKQHIIGL